MRSAFGHFSTPVTHTGMGRFPRLNGAFASGERVSISYADGRFGSMGNFSVLLLTFSAECVLKGKTFAVLVVFLSQ